MKGGFRPTLTARMKYRIFSFMLKDLQESGLVEDEDRRKELAIVTRKTEYSQTPKEVQPRLELLNNKSLLDYYELIIQRKSPLESLLQFYYILNTKIPELTKTDILRFLSLSIHQKPKEDYARLKLERETNDLFNKNKLMYSARHKEVSEKRRRYQQLHVRLMEHYYEHLAKGMLKDVLPAPPGNEYLNIDASDLIPSYSLVFQNVEKVIEEYWNKTRDCFNVKELITVLVGFSIAQEGSDYFYESLGESLLAHSNEMDITDIDCFLNTYPHGLWMKSEIMKQRPDLLISCYGSIFNKLLTELPTINKELFLSLLQGFLSVHPNLYKSNTLLDTFIMRSMEMISNKQLTDEEVTKLLELLTEFVQSNTNLNVQAIGEYIHKLYLTNIDLNQLTITNITSILWSFYRMDYLPKEYFGELLEKGIEKVKEANLKLTDVLTLTQLMENSKLLIKVEKKIPSRNSWILTKTVEDLRKLTASEDLFN
jgi:hypothetical protein